MIVKHRLVDCANFHPPPFPSPRWYCPWATGGLCLWWLHHTLGLAETGFRWPRQGSCGKWVLHFQIFFTDGECSVFPLLHYFIAGSARANINAHEASTKPHRHHHWNLWLQWSKTSWKMLWDAGSTCHLPFCSVFFICLAKTELQGFHFGAWLHIWNGNYRCDCFHCNVLLTYMCVVFLKEKNVKIQLW